MKRILSVMVKSLASSRLALVLVFLLIVFAAVGALLPQEGRLAAADIALWQGEHPLATAVFKPLGGFSVFHSFPFLAVIVLFAVNTLTCTMITLAKDGGPTAFFRTGPVKRIGFLVLHLSLLLLFIGGFLSTAASLDGRIILTEGQGFTEKHENYRWLSEGPLRNEHHRGFVFLLKEVSVQFEEVVHPVDVTTRHEIIVNGRKVAEPVIRINRPLTFDGMTFTQDEIGYSPRLTIRDSGTGKVVGDAFWALKTFRHGIEWEYRDFLPLPIFDQRVIVTLYPSHRIEGGRVVKTSEEPENPLLLVEAEDGLGETTKIGHVILGGDIEIGGHLLTFAGLRRWASFRVMEDHGYPLVMIGLWLGVAALLFRYANALRRWFGPARQKSDAGEDKV